MKIEKFNTDEKVFIIAEIGNNHEGNFELAEKMIGLAAESGADAVKFQTFRTEHYVSNKDEARFKRLKGFELTFDQFEKLKIRADKEKIIFMSTPFDLQSANFLSNIVPAYKIGSGENTFYPLLEFVASTGKPVILSSGISELTQIKTSKTFIEECWQKAKKSSELAILHCVSSYPTPIDQANLGAITVLSKELDCTVGYSDHTLGINACVLSVACGARIIEKHFTIDKNYSSFRDHQLSADPADLRQLVSEVREAEVLLGTAKKFVQICEEGSLIPMRRSIVATRDLRTGEIITLDDITWVRPGGGMAPGLEDRLIGHKLAADVSAGQMLSADMVVRK